jgi:hypothetical protein
MEDITDSLGHFDDDIVKLCKEYKVKLVKHHCNMCQNGRIPNPQLQDIILPTETYFKTFVGHNDSHFRSPLSVLCEVQRKIRCFKDGTQNRADLAMYRSLQARTKKAGLSHRDDFLRQAGVPSGKRYAVYVDLEMEGTPKRSPCARLAKMSKRKRAPSQPQHKVKTKTARNPEPKTSGGDGVCIQNAEIPELNGWYRERESTVRPANAQTPTSGVWRRWNQDRQWYRKDGGCYIVWYYSGPNNCGWYLRDAGGKNRYVNYGSRGRESPPADGWKFWSDADAEALNYGRAKSRLVARTS